MTKDLRFIGVLAVAGTMLMMNSCKKDVSPAENISYEEVLKSGGEFESFQNYKILSNSSTSSIPVDSGNWNCTNNTYTVLQGNDDFPIYDPNVSVVYPGSLLQGASLNNATPDVVALKRGPGTVSIDLVNGSNYVYVNLPEVKKSYITQALNDIVNDNNEVLPARFNFQHQEVKTKEELALALNVDVDIAPVTVGAEFEFSNESEMNHYLVTLKQTFFTMSYDIPSTYDEFFDPSVTPMDLAKYVGPNNPACYVSDVTYGRVFHLLIESSSSIMKIKAAVNLSFSNAPVSGEIEANYLSSLDDLSVKVLALGGSITPTFSAISASSLSSLTTQLGKSTDIQAGVPLSYVVRTVYNNKLVKNKIDLQYTISDCALVP
jgi:thiol-activated cytolysin